MPETRPMQHADHPAVLAGVESLTEWFDADARGRAIPLDLRNQEGSVAVSDGEVVGFVTTFSAEGRINIGWLGVHADDRRRGIGAKLIAGVEELGRKHGLAEIAACTLGPGVDYAPFESTRQFYLKQGFEVYQTNRTDNPGCPEEVRIRKRIARG